MQAKERLKSRSALTICYRVVPSGTLSASAGSVVMAVLNSEQFKIQERKYQLILKLIYKSFFFARDRKFYYRYYTACLALLGEEGHRQWR